MGCRASVDISGPCPLAREGAQEQAYHLLRPFWEARGSHVSSHGFQSTRTPSPPAPKEGCAVRVGQ